MDRRHSKWFWLLILGLLVALFIVSSPAAAEVNSLNITGATSPTPSNPYGTVSGEATYSGATPTFMVRLIDPQTKDRFEVPVVQAFWLSNESWHLSLEVEDVPDGDYWVQVRAEFSDGQVIFDTYGTHITPGCDGLCIPGG